MQTECNMPELNLNPSSHPAAVLFDAWARAGKGDTMAKGHWPMVSQVIERMELQPGLQCLDVGCGNGYAVRAIALRVFPGGQAEGVDVSPEMVEQATRHPDNPPQVRFAISSADALPFDSEQWDRVLSVEALYYIANPLAALKEWHRVLRPGGSVWVMVDYFKENPYCQTWGDLIDLPMQLYGVREYRELLERAGFTAVTSSRLFNPAPLDADYIDHFKPGWGYSRIEDVVDFRTRVGSLLLTGKKSSLDIPNGL
jgi:ubiquinone/menaquinone biosynthesis C-methylase UbiE